MPIVDTNRFTLAAGLAVASLILTSCDSTPSLVEANDVETKSVGTVASASNAFACDLYAEIRQTEGNLFFSPASISTALAMTWAGAEGTTAQEMAEVLHLDAVENPHAGFSALLSLLNSRGTRNGYILRTANRLWGAESYPIREPFLELMDARYRAGLAKLDFSDPAEASATINDWISEQTSGLIPELVGPGTLSKRTRLVLTNAIYFKGGWEDEFDPSETELAPFHLASGETIHVPTMYQKYHFTYTEDENVQVLVLPYRGRDVSMMIVLPKEKDGLPTVEASLTPKQLQRWHKNRHEYTLVKIFLPKFEIRSRLSLSEILSDLGMASAFSSTTADFSGISSEPGLCLSSVIHEAYVKTDEKGTEAAAATGAAVSGAIAIDQEPPQPKIFRADHPFLILIQDNDSGVILFMGRVADP